MRRGADAGRTAGEEADGLIARLDAGERRALPRIATHVERDDDLGRACLERLYPRIGQAHVVGLTGPPGAGKSSLIDALVTRYRARDSRVAVIAIDPTSPLSGGATLGDRLRMMGHHADDGVFLRSMASRGQAGGLAPATVGLVHLMDAAGFDRIVVETVGTGQSDIDVSRLGGTTVVVQVPGAGDTVQSLKAGILEVGDLLVVTKGDLPQSATLARDLRTLLTLAEPPAEGDDRTWSVPVVTTSAQSGEGVDDLVGHIEAHREYLGASGEDERRRRATVSYELGLLVRRRIERESRPGGGAIADLVERVVRRELTPWDAAALVVDGRVARERQG